MIRETGHVATDGPGKRGQPPGSGRGSDGSTKGGRDKGAIDSQPRLCVGSMEHKDGSLNRQVKTKDPGPPGSVRQRARKLCSPSRKCIFSLQPRSPQQHQHLHPYSEVPVLTRHHLLGPRVVRTLSPVA